MRICAGCQGEISAKLRSDAKYCSDTCSKTAEKRRYRDRHGFTSRPPKGPYKVARKVYEGRRERSRTSARKRPYIPVLDRNLVRREAKELGFRSGFERTLAAQMKSTGIKFEYEPIKLAYVHEHVYVPDFRLPNGIIIEAKGLLDQATRSKMLAVKRAYPELDIRFIFMRANNTITKNSKTTYGDWATKNGFPWADGRIPEEWVEGLRTS